MQQQQQQPPPILTNLPPSFHFTLRRVMQSYLDLPRWQLQKKNTVQLSEDDFAYLKKAIVDNVFPPGAPSKDLVLNFYRDDVTGEAMAHCTSEAVAGVIENGTGHIGDFYFKRDKPFM